MERRGTGFNWRSQALKLADVSLQKLEAHARTKENRKRRILRRLVGDCHGRGAALFGKNLINRALKCGFTFPVK
jgi:hypothetical protein